MVDPIGFRPSTPVERRGTSRVSASVRTPVAAGSDQSASTAAAQARSMAARPPVDTERVAEIRKAIAEGRFPITPATIADRLIALKLNWDPNDPA